MTRYVRAVVEANQVAVSLPAPRALSQMISIEYLFVIMHNRLIKIVKLRDQGTSLWSMHHNTYANKILFR